MSELIEITLPKLGESILGATVVKWLKQKGERVSIDEALVEVSTDKVNSEIPSPVAGTLEEILVQEGDEIEVGTPLARVLVKGGVKEERAQKHVAPPPLVKCPHEGEEIFSPAVLRLAQSEGIPIEKLREIEGSGEGGRVTKKDVENFLQRRAAPQLAEGEERVEMSRMRKAIAENTIKSFYEAPHASLVTEADVTEVVHLIAREKARFKETHGVNLTITSFIIQALTKAILQFPMLNASLAGETIIMKRYVNIGIAVHIENGLVVPVIKNCQERNLVSIAKALAEVSQKARSGKLSIDDVKEGTITLTNFGMAGALIGIPIIRYPEVAIIGAGSVKKRVVVRDDDSFSIRHMLYLTLTFDHRVLDGIYGCQFLAAFKNHLESIANP